MNILEDCCKMAAESGSGIISVGFKMAAESGRGIMSDEHLRGIVTRWLPNLAEV